METKSKIKQRLINHKNIFNKDIYDYLNSLLELEISAVRESLNENEKRVLNNFPIYQQIAIYNIYNRALKIISELDLGIPIKKNRDELSISTSIGKLELPLFSFAINDDDLLGTIDLYKRVFDKDVNEKLLENTKEKLTILYSEKCPYHENEGIDDPLEIVYGGPSSIWLGEYNDKVRHLQELLTRLSVRKELTKDESDSIYYTEKIQRSLLEDYGLNETNLVCEEKQELESIEKIEDEKEKAYALLAHAMKTYNSSCGIQPKEDEKTLSKKLPLVVINSNIKYII